MAPSVVPASAIPQGSPSVAAGGRSLDLRTELPLKGHWLARAWPQAGEASLCYIATGATGGEANWFLADGFEDQEDDVEALEALEVERRARNHERATRRAAGSSRRFMVANRLRYMWVLTFEEGLHGVDGRAECMRRVAAFAERLTAKYGRIPYWYSPELHPGGHGWHVNFFVGRRLPHGVVEGLWGQGFVWVKDWLKDSRIASFGLPLVVAIRLGALYGCKYASKDWSEEVLSGGAHRYEVAQGFQPDEHVERLATLAEAMAFVVAMFGGHTAEHSWCSFDSPSWDGPAVYCLSWTDGLDERVPGG